MFWSCSNMKWPDQTGPNYKNLLRHCSNRRQFHFSAATCIFPHAHPRVEFWWYVQKRCKIPHTAPCYKNQGLVSWHLLLVVCAISFPFRQFFPLTSGHPCALKASYTTRPMPPDNLPFRRPLPHGAHILWQYRNQFCVSTLALWNCRAEWLKFRWVYRSLPPNGRYHTSEASLGI